MATTVSSLVMIGCPQCGTRYQVAPETLGKRGRKVTCAECGEVWQAKPISHEPDDSDRLFSEEDEAELDAAFAAAEPGAGKLELSDDLEAEQAAKPPAEEGVGGPMRSIAEIKAKIAPGARPTSAILDQSDRNRQKQFAQRQDAQRKYSPLARMRRVLRIAGVGTLLALIIGGVTFRTEVVRQYPDLAGAYEALGLGVNVVGLEFRDVSTLIALKGGTNVLRVDARIYSVAARRVAVPPVSVTLLDDAGTSLYEWGVVPDTGELRPGEMIDFTTQLSSPPPGVTRVRLTFMDGKAPTAFRPEHG